MSRGYVVSSAQRGHTVYQDSLTIKDSIAVSMYDVVDQHDSEAKLAFAAFGRLQIAIANLNFLQFWMQNIKTASSESNWPMSFTKDSLPRSNA